MSITIVVAMADNRVIGADGGMPWHLPADLAHFKALTLGHPMIMGRATFDSIGRPLPGRTTIVVTRQPDWKAEGVIAASSLQTALQLGGGFHEDIMIVGGAQIYEQALQAGLVDRLEITEIDIAPDGDTFFPEIGPEWFEVARESHRDGEIAFDFVSYRR